MDAQTLLRENLGRVYGLALRLAGNEADAWDLTQEAFLRALKALPGFRGDSAAATWLFRITVNAWKNRRASSAWRFWSRAAPIEPSSDGDGAFPDPDPGPERALEQAETGRLLEEALVSLSPEERAALSLRELEGLSYGQIGEILDLPVGTVKSRIHRARQALAKHWEIKHGAG